jgi:hypothetical protein
MKSKNSMIYGPTTTACTPNHLIPIELGKGKKIIFLDISVLITVFLMNLKRDRDRRVTVA